MTDTARTDISLTFAKGLKVMKCFGAEASHLTIAEIARRAGLDRAVARRLVLTLVDLGYVAQSDRVFALTPRVLVLAGQFLQGRRFGLAIQPVLEGFAEQTGMPISLAMRDETEAVYVAHAGTRDVAPRLGFTVGSHLPLLQSAIGRALFAAEPRATREAILADLAGEVIPPDLDCLLPGTVQIVEGGVEDGVTGMALPVIGAGGTAAALGLSAPRAELAEPARRGALTDALHNASAILSAVL